ncbi:hypothetical protein [Paenibacillus silvisoli]|uniref:hypothetical protein n=1 Tax=Paenibacillus silvisoli TaxID=3110539 RepID=UPI002803B8DB|nr:hypothetical protein [Paenibacillus silvisoli]
MRSEPIRHAVRNPAGMAFLTAIIIMCPLSFINTAIIFRDNHNLTWLTVTIIQFIIVAVGLMISIYGALQKPAELLLSEGELTVNGVLLEARDIQVIMKRGYFRPIIGIKPHGARIVPVKLCFRFIRDEDKGIADLGGWAAKNELTMVQKRFIRWI